MNLEYKISPREANSVIQIIIDIQQVVLVFPARTVARVIIGELLIPLVVTR